MEENKIDQKLFLETLYGLKENIKDTHRILTENEILNYFKKVELTKEQEKLLVEYVQAFQNKNKEEKQTKQDIINKEKIKNMESGFSDTIFYQIYMDDIKNVQKISKKQKQKMYEKLLNGDKSMVQELSKQWLNPVFAFAKEYALAKDQLQDVIQEGNLAVFLELNQLVGKKGIKDCEHLVENAARKAMEKFIIESAGYEDMTSSIIAKTVLVKEAQDYLAEDLQRLPTQKELSQYTKIPINELEDLLAIIKEKNNK